MTTVWKVIEAENQSCDGQNEAVDTTFWTEAQSSLLEILRWFRETCHLQIQVYRTLICHDDRHISFFSEMLVRFFQTKQPYITKGTELAVITLNLKYNVIWFWCKTGNTNPAAVQFTHTRN